MAACALLLAVYGALSLLNDPRGYLGTDTGAKVATLKMMTERHRLDPDVGYWAESWDPSGRVHPLYSTSRVGGGWVNVTTLPMLYLAYPLYEVGGYRMALLLPMAGAVLAALAARALARRLSEGDGWLAFWLVGLASPLLIYALDFWEHSLGVAAMAWAVVLLTDVVVRRRPPGAALAAGVLFGLAATLRTESLVYGFAAVGLACLTMLGRRLVSAALALGALALVGLAVPLAANQMLERATVGDSIRSERAAGTASAAASTGGAVAGSRLEEAILNAAALHPALEVVSYLVGAALLGLLVFAVLRSSRRGDYGPAFVAGAGVMALYAIRFAEGPGFVPSLVAATPLAVASVAVGRSSAVTRYVLGVGLLALPIVWATQFQGGAAPQWGARYLLTSGLLFGAVGIATLPRLHLWARRGLVGLAMAVTGFGALWTSIRTHDVARASSALFSRAEPVLVSRVGHLAREAGAFYGDKRWLTAVSDDDQQYAVGVIEQAGITEFALVQFDARDQAQIAGWRVARVDHVHFLRDVDFRVTVYQAGRG